MLFKPFFRYKTVRVKMKKIIYSLFLLFIFCADSSGAEEVSYFNPYTKTYENIQLNSILVTQKIRCDADNQNEKNITIELATELIQKIESEFIPKFEFLFTTDTDQKLPLWPLQIIFTERLTPSKKMEFKYQAYYTPLYRTQLGHEVLWVSLDKLSKDELYFYIAHELFHLYYRLRWNDAPKWIEEGLAHLFGYLFTGFFPQYQITKYFESPQISLEDFPVDSPKYYGHAFLFFYYLYMHHLTYKDLKPLVQSEHPKTVLDSKGLSFQEIFTHFSIAKLFNTIYVHPNQAYSLKPTYGRIEFKNLQDLSAWNPKPWSSFYVKIDQREALQEMWGAWNSGQKNEQPGKLIFVQIPQYGFPKVLPEQNTQNATHILLLTFASSQ